MKKILIILVLSIFLLIGCSAPETVTETSIITKTVTKVVEVENTDRIEELEGKLDESQEEVEKYKALISDLNELLSNVYYGYASNSKYILDGFTAFSIEYKGKYYLITAGHCVENEYGKFGNFKFKANFSDEWIYPKLLTYNIDKYAENDYAIFTSDKIKSGFDYGEPLGINMILGSADNNLNIVRSITKTNKNGESGSPIVNENGEVIGILTGGITKIDKVLKAIDNLK